MPKKILEEYRIQKSLYALFAKDVESILRKLFHIHSVNTQSISSREKGEKELKGKIRRKHDEKSPYKKLTDCKDLAGVRAIFYFNQDLNRARELIEGQFEMIEDPKEITKESGYFAFHFVIKLKDDRIRYPEYKLYRDLECEIQFTTTLHHAWSEPEHDMIYKDKEGVKDFNLEAFGSIEKRFKKIMEEHIIVAAAELDQLSNDYKFFSSGPSIFSKEYLNSILRVKSNDEIVSRLSLLIEHVRRNGYKFDRNIDVINCFIKIFKKAKKIRVKIQKTPFGNLKGKSCSDVGIKLLEALSLFKYYQINKTLRFIFEMLNTKDQGIHDKIKELFKNLTKYDHHVLGQIGLTPQFMILDWLRKSKLPNKTKIIADTAQIILQADFTDVEWKDYKTVKFGRRTFNYFPQMDKLRKKTINLLIKLYTNTNKISDKLDILEALSKASESKGGETKMLELVIKNTNRILNFYLSLLRTNKASLEEMDKMSHQAYFMLEWHKEKAVRAKTLRNKIEQNEFYQIFGKLYGYEGRKMWETKRSHQEIRQDIELAIKNIIDSINIDNFNYWSGQIERAVKHYFKNPERWKYESFLDLFYQLGEKNPEIAILLIKSGKKAFLNFLLQVLAGLWKSNQQRECKKFIKEFLKQGKFLKEIVGVFEINCRQDEKWIDLIILKKIIKRAKANKDIDILNLILKTLDNAFDASPQKIKKEIIGIIKFLKALNESGWTKYWWHNAKFVLSLNSTEVNTVLDALVLADRIDTELEALLSPISKKYPLRVIKFFEKRIERKKRKEVLDFYDPIPHTSRLIPDLLKNSKAMGKVLGWFKKANRSKSNWVYKYEAEDMIKFADSKQATREVRKLASGDSKAGSTAVDILRALIKRGSISTNIKNEHIQKVAQKIIKRYYNHKAIPAALKSAITQTGIVTGMNGFLKKYEEYRDYYSDPKTGWVNHKNENVKKFAEEIIKYLKKKISEEKRSVAREGALYKRGFY